MFLPGRGAHAITFTMFQLCLGSVSLHFAECEMITEHDRGLSFGRGAPEQEGDEA